MNTGVISKRYAKALYLFAKESKQEKLVYREMSTLADSYLQVPALRLRSAVLRPQALPLLPPGPRNTLPIRLQVPALLL